MRAIDAVRRSVVKASPDETFQVVARRMADQNVGAVVIVDGDAPVGIVTDRDLAVRALAHGYTDGRVDSVMSSELVVAEADADLRDVIHHFGKEGVRRVLLARDGAVVGVLSVDDLVIDLVSDLGEVVRPITAEVIFGHHDASVPTTTGGGG